MALGWIVLAVVLLLLLIVLAAVLAASASASLSASPRASFRASNYHGGGDDMAQISWDCPNKCYPKEMIASCEKFIRNLVRESRSFGPVTAKEKEALTAEAERLRSKYGIEISTEQLVAVRNMEIALEAKKSGARALQLGPDMLAASNKGDSVIAIARRYRLPPMTVLKQILMELGFTYEEARELATRDPENMPSNLAREARAIAEADLGSRLNAVAIRDKSRAYEEAVKLHLQKLGLKFKTEEDLRTRKQTSPVLTPDFLLDEPVTIDGKVVHWIDAKDYPMFESKLVMRNLAIQNAKYNKAFGPGAMVFSGGLMCDARIYDASVYGNALPPLLLDGSHIA